MVRILAAFGLLLGALAAASDLDEFKVKREEVFAFASPPKIARSGDHIEIAFATQGACDVTIAIEDANGAIIRHLASGVLGANAPAPFQKDSHSQRVIWDGKDDRGRYVDEKDQCSVRVSLGLKPQFERTLFWSPHKRHAETARGPYASPAPDGVYVFDGEFEDHLRLFDHDGNYVRTIYPFPREKLEHVQGLTWHEYPQGYRLPLKTSSWKQTFLTSGASHGGGSSAATAMAVKGNRIALAEHRLNRLSTDGSTGGLPLEGPSTAMRVPNDKDKEVPVAPRSLAFSPDGKKLYTTGYCFEKFHWFQAVMVMDYAGHEAPKVFAGSTDLGAARSKDKGKESDLRVPTSVACDAQNRVYVADHGKDRIQVYTPDGKLHKSIPIAKPTQVEVDPKTGEIYVFSWLVYCRFINEKGTPAVFTRLGPVDNPVKKASYPLPLEAYIDGPSMWLGKSGNLQFYAAVDFWTSPPSIWLTVGATVGSQSGKDWDAWGRSLQILREEGGKLELKKDFAQVAGEKVGRLRPAQGHNQRLYVNPADGSLYVGEGDTGCLHKDFSALLRFDPETGKMDEIKVPFHAEDAAFDLDGNIALRTTNMVARFDPKSWREIPWDYGEERGKFIGVLVLPSTSPVCYHQGGMAYNAKGHLLIACSYRFAGDNLAEQRWDPKKINPDDGGKKYAPTLYPGRTLGSTSAFAHIWDRKGRILYDDAVQGMPQVDGIALDADDNVYMMATPARVLDGERYFNKLTETVMKFQPGKGRFLSASKRAQIPLDRAALPKRDADIDDHFRLGQTWVEGAEWFYGGVGFAGFNGVGCACKFVRFTLDHFARSFAPENDQFRVAVLDTNGNLILRVGQYGNVDDGKPLVLDGGSAATRSIGGDEVALMHPRFLATHSDRRLFIADPGNARILSVKLGYHAEERIQLKDVPDQLAAER